MPETSPDPKQEEQKPPAPELTPEQIEENYWTQFEARLNKWFDGKIKEVRTTSPGRMGRTTLPEVMANIFFGPPKDKS